MTVNIKKIKKIRKRHKKERDQYKPFIMIDEDSDAIFNLGGKLSEWKGAKISQMALDHDGRRVLRFCVGLDNIDEEVVELIEEKLNGVFF